MKSKPLSGGFFLFGLLLIAIALGYFEYVTNPFLAGSPAGHIARVVTYLLFFVLLGVLLWVPVRLIKGKESAPDLRLSTLITVAILASLLVVVHWPHSTRLIKRDRSRFVAYVEKTCFSTSRALEELAELSDSTIHEFCSCYAAELSKVITSEDVGYFVTQSDIPTTLTDKMTESEQRCAEKVAVER